MTDKSQAREKPTGKQREQRWVGPTEGGRLPRPPAKVWQLPTCCLWAPNPHFGALHVTLEFLPCQDAGRCQWRGGTGEGLQESGAGLLAPVMLPPCPRPAVLSGQPRGTSGGAHPPDSFTSTSPAGSSPESSTEQRLPGGILLWSHRGHFPAQATCADFQQVPQHDSSA